MRAPTCFRWSALVVAWIAAAGPASAGTLEHEFEFVEQELSVAVFDGYDFITLPGCDVTREPGRPQLPVLPATIALPPGASVTGLEVVSAESRELLGEFNPRPAQRPRILPIPGIELPDWEFTPPDRAVYEARAPYPATIARLTSTGRLSANTAAGMLIHPVQFVPDAGKLRFFRRVVVRVHYEQEPPSGTLTPRRAVRGFGRSVATNPEGLALSRGSVTPSETALEEADIEYVIIADDDHDGSFRPLAEWKTRKGVPASIVTTQWIDATYSGADLAEKIRRFVADAHETWGTVWVLLGGDTSWVPTRSAYAMTCEAGGHADEDELACDLYFGDLDGDWNADGDDTYGEVEDGVDLYPDVFVGRAPVTVGNEATVFVNKVLAYERGQDTSHNLDMLMAAEVLWDDPFTDSGIALNLIDREYVPPRYDPITKLYETLGNETVESVIAALNAGQGHVLHSGHAWYTVMGCGDGYMTRTDVDGLTNASGQPVLYSIGCWPAAFDLDQHCIAEHFLRNPIGGATAFMGNSRYGWASPGNPGYGYSERFMQQFYRMLFVEQVANAGAALAAAKATLIPLSQSQNVYRWHQYELNLLGDPEMPIWTNEPLQLTVSHADTVVAGASTFDVVAWTTQGPVDGALVCVTNGSDVYARALTGADGAVALAIETVLPDSLHVTVSGMNLAPYESTVPVHLTGVYLRTAGFTIDDSLANGDGLAGPGEDLELLLQIRNFGTQGATGVSASLSSSDTWISVGSGSASFPDIPGGATETGTPPFAITVADGCPDGHVAVLDLTITSDEARGAWSGAITLPICSPVLAAGSYDTDDTWGGDGDGVPEPGEHVRVMVEIVNSGHSDAIGVTASLDSDDPGVVVTAGDVEVQRIAAGESSQAVFEIGIGHGVIAPHFPELRLDLGAEGETAWSDTIVVAIGSAGFAHDFEQGDQGWTHGGTSDLWNRTDNRSHSGSTSWYCGTPGSWEYVNGMNSTLDSPPFVLGADMELSFWCWYSLPIYHEDGLFVELLSSDGAAIDTLDFIGSGGALETLGSIGNDWLEYRYALAGQTGDTVRVRFRFTTDATEVDEGVYIDDAAVATAAAPSGTGVADSEQEEPRIGYLHQNAPNPFGLSTTITFSLRESGDVVLAIYNIQGRLIRTLKEGPHSAGDHEVTWDGKDDLGADVAAGVYLYRLAIGEYEEARKMILVR
jgi:hypothetical protein